MLFWTNVELFVYRIIPKCIVGYHTELHMRFHIIHVELNSFDSLTTVSTINYLQKLLVGFIFLIIFRSKSSCWSLLILIYINDSRTPLFFASDTQTPLRGLKVIVISLTKNKNVKIKTIESVPTCQRHKSYLSNNYI